MCGCILAVQTKACSSEAALKGSSSPRRHPFETQKVLQREKNATRALQAQCMCLSFCPVVEGVSSMCILCMQTRDASKMWFHLLPPFHSSVCCPIELVSLAVLCVGLLSPLVFRFPLAYYYCTPYRLNTHARFLAPVLYPP